jgi:Fe-S cluster assembly iron-binding protein IscA
MIEKTDNGKVLEITQAAVDKIAGLIAKRGKGPQAIRVVLRGRSLDGNLMSDFMFVEIGSCEETDVVQEVGPFPLYFDQNSAEGLGSSTRRKPPRWPPDRRRNGTTLSPSRSRR